MRRVATTAVLSIVAVPVLLAVPVTTLPAAKAHPVRASEQTLALGDFLRPAAAVAATTSQIAGRALPTLRVRKEATRNFSAVAVTWRAAPKQAAITVQVRAKRDSGWTSWRTAGADDQSPPAAGEARTGSDLVWLGASHGVEIAVSSAAAAAPSDLQVRLIDPGTSAADAYPGGRQPASRAGADPTRPTIYGRDQWGADERLMTWPTEYSSTIKAGFLHHTVQTTSYTPAEVPGMIRADYRYHAVTRGWGDIGYNFLVDYFGRIWQGRAGNVALAGVGAHTGGFNSYTFGIAMIGDFSRFYVPSGVQTSVSRVFAWKLAMYGRSPYGSAVLTSSGGGTSRYPAGVVVTKPVVMGHRDVGSTACPGQYGYATLPYVRSLTAKYMVTGATDGGPTGPWPLVADQVFAYSGSSRVINGSDAQASYRPYIAAIQREVIVPQTSRYDSATVHGVERWQALVGLARTGVVDSNTWRTMTVR